MPAHTVFLSSTFTDFKIERPKLADLLSYVGVHAYTAERAGDTGKKLLETLKDLIDRSDMVVLLIGSRAGTMSGTGHSWTKNEIDYAFATGKRVFAYVREVPSEQLSLIDRNRDSECQISLLLNAVEARVAIIPRYGLNECCKLTTMVIRDVLRYVEEVNAASAQKTYDESFVR